MSDFVKDVNGIVGRVTDRWRQGGEDFVRVEFDGGGSRVAPEGCFNPVRPCSTCGKPGHLPQDHAGWDPTKHPAMTATASPPPGGPWIQTCKGRAWVATDPESYVYDVEEIAHALSHVGRFTGHTREFYSVAQHSILVAHLAMTDEATREMPGSVILEIGRRALLHDASEAFLADVASPIKALPEMAGYRALERRVEEAIRAYFTREGLFSTSPGSGHYDRIVKRADLVALAVEKRDLLGPSPHDALWAPLPEPRLPENVAYALRTRPPSRLVAVASKFAGEAFLEHWRRLAS